MSLKPDNNVAGKTKLNSPVNKQFKRRQLLASSALSLQH